MTKQQAVKKARSKAWSPEARAKRAATMAARKAGKVKTRTYKFQGTDAASEMRDVVSFLEHAERAILKSGGKRITAAESYAMLALTTLRGG